MPTTLSDVLAQGFKAVWSADQFATLVDGTAVNTLPDATGNGFTASQATGTKQPLLKQRTANGKTYWSIQYDGTNDWLTIPGSITAQAFTVFAVVMSLASAGSHNIFNQANASAPFTNFGQRDSTGPTTPRFSYYSGGAGDGLSTSHTLLTSTWYAATALFNGAASDLWVNGFEFIPTNNRTQSSNGTATWALGANGNGTAEFWNGDIPFAGLYPGVASAGVRSVVHSYCQDTFGISVTDYSAGAKSPWPRRNRAHGPLLLR